MATSGSFSTSKYTQSSGRAWSWEFKWNVSSWSGNTATVKWTITTRCSSGTSRINMDWLLGY